MPPLMAIEVQNEVIALFIYILWEQFIQVDVGRALSKSKWSSNFNFTSRKNVLSVNIAFS